MENPQNGWSRIVMENPTLDDLGVPPFLETPIGPYGLSGLPYSSVAFLFGFWMLLDFGWPPAPSMHSKQ